MITNQKIRNFCIIAHIDHGKSTLADRMLEFTGTVEKRKMKDQLLDQMDLERERGITIKLQPATMDFYFSSPGEEEWEGKYILNLIDTPGHVDFSYEVSRSLAAVEGAILLVDATQGIQAQTLSNLYQAIEQDLVIIPVVNKIDLPNADIEKTKKEIISILGCQEKEIISASGKTGQGVEEVLAAIVKKVPPPQGEPQGAARGLIFDSKYDPFKGVIAFVRIVDGEIKEGDEIYLMAAEKESQALEVGKFRPSPEKTGKLSAGEVGYIATGLKSVTFCRVGDTITLQEAMAGKDGKGVLPLRGYKEVKPMVYASFYPKEGEDYNQLKDALDKLKLNDAALSYEGESSLALGRGFRIGFLGLLHLEITQQRLKREFGFEPIITIPSVVYEIVLKNGEVKKIFSASELPDPTLFTEIREPFVNLEIVTPAKFLGKVMETVRNLTRAEYKKTEYIDQERIIISFEAPLSEVIVNLHDGIKSATSGFASFSYDFLGYRSSDLVRLDVYVAEEKVEAFAKIVPRQKAQQEARRIVAKLKDSIPRQNFLIKLQAAVGGKFLARENIRPFRKDVTGHLYGGDVTRKRKLLEKQKRGKKRMLGKGRVEIPADAFLKVLKKDTTK